MRFETVKDIIEVIRQLHDALSRQYAELEQLATSERATLMLDYLARHERRLAAALQHYEQDAARGILETWLQHIPELDATPLVEQVRAADLNDVEAVVAAALAVDEHLLAVYRELEQRAPTDTLREIAHSLQQLECNEAQRLARAAFRLRDY
ncbi:MAG: hypothetical protein IT469_09590 [Pseudomonadales bacterium]|nr:hypothetical protein [Pseudomonadales bacterium]